MLRESNIPYEAARFYSATTALYVFLFALGLFLSDAYLFAGRNAYIPVCAILVVAEILKYTFIQLVYHKDISYGPKQGFKLFSIMYHFATEIKVIELVRNMFVLVGFTCVFFVIAVLLGAEVLGKHEETLMFSYLMTVLTVFPVCLHQGLPSVVQILNGTQGSDPFTQVLLRNVQFSVLGAWLGAFVIPLDWDREWQVWPIPCSFGSLLGFEAAQVFSLVELLTKFTCKFSNLRNKQR